MSVITERFEVEREVGTGGMGTVFRAIDRESGAPVALKVLQKQLHSETERFLLEARVLAQLQHPAIVRYIAHGVTTEGAPYIAMEWLDGEDLWARLQQRVFTVEETVLLARRLAEALASAHAQGIVHRDIKPSNIFLEHGEVGRVKLLDFGVARILDLQRQLTMTGTFLGTPAYTAPEQARGERHVGPEADVFSLGCVLFECLTGRGPFDADNVMAVLTRLLMEQPARLRDHRRDIPEAVATLVERMIIKDPKKRPSNGAAVLTEICSLTWQNANAAAAAAAAQVAPQVVPQVAAPYSAAIHTSNSSSSVVLSSPEPHSTPAERLARSGLMRRIEEPESKKAASPFESQVTHIQPRLEGGPPPPVRSSGPMPSRPNPIPSIPSHGSGSPVPPGSSYIPYGQPSQSLRGQPSSYTHPAPPVQSGQPPSRPHPAPHAPSGQPPSRPFPAPHGPSAHSSSYAHPHAPSAQQPPPSQAHPAPQAPSARSTSQAHPAPQAQPAQPSYPPKQSLQAPQAQPSMAVPHTPQHPPVTAPPPVPSASRPITARYAPPFAAAAPSASLPVNTPAPPVNAPAPSGPSPVLPTPAPAPVPVPSIGAPITSPPPSFRRPAISPASPGTPLAPPTVSHAPTSTPQGYPAPSYTRPAISQAPATLVPGAPPPMPPGASAHAKPTGQHAPPTTASHAPPPTATRRPPTASVDLPGDQSPPTQAVPSRPAPPSSRPGSSSQLKRYKLMGFAASLVEHREKPSNLSELSDIVYDLLAKYVSMPWAMMQSHCTRMGKDPYNIQPADLELLAEPLSKAVTPFAGPKGAAVLLQELRSLL